MKKYIFSVLIVLFLSAGLLYGALEINFQATNTTFNAFYPSYLNPLEPETQPILFTVSFLNTGTDELNFNLVANLDWNGNYLLNNVDITTDMPLGAGAANAWNLTSREIFAQQSSYFSADFDFDDVINSNSDFEDQILNTGQFPNGVYTFTIEAKDSNGNTIPDTQETFRFIIQSPAPIILLTPGTIIGMTPTEIQDSNPTFIWNSNLAGMAIESATLAFTLNVYSLEDIPEALLNADAIGNETPYFTIEQDITSFSYPAHARPLEAGKLYAWQVTFPLVYPGSSGSEEIKSQMFIFRIASNDDSGSDGFTTASIDPGTGTTDNKEQSLEAITYFIKTLPKEDQDTINRLLNSGYTPESIINYQNDYKPINTLFDVSELILSGEKRIISVTIE